MVTAAQGQQKLAVKWDKDVYDKELLLIFRVRKILIQDLSNSAPTSSVKWKIIAIINSHIRHSKLNKLIHRINSIRSSQMSHLHAINSMQMVH